MNNTFKMILVLALISFIACNRGERRNNSGEPIDPETHDLSAWNNVNPGLNASFSSTNNSYKRSTPPLAGLQDTFMLRAWRGEEVHLQVLIWSGEDMGEVKIITEEESASTTNGISSVRHSIVKYVISDEFLDGCGKRNKDTIAAHISPDILEPGDKLTMGKNETRPVWISLETSSNCKPGIYSYNTKIKSPSDSISLHFKIEVIDKVLPPPSEWSFHLDLWQNPYSVARYHKVQLWSQEHWDLIKPLLEKLASAGQKCITTTLNDKPWGGQTYDPFGSMITWIKDDTDNWFYDYSVFDQYVTFAMSCGITKQINCYSMVPWNNRFIYYNEKTTAYEELIAVPGTEEYNNLWTPFLHDFREHLRDMGWLQITSIAMDEREEKDMKKIIDLIRSNAPEIKISLAGNILQPSIDSEIYDLSIAIGLKPDRNDIIERVASGRPTTFYTCCARPEHPNNFTFSPPADNTYIGWYAAGNGYSGFLRWAYNSWVENPLYDSRFRTWPSGDTYLIYPEAISSVRFEKLIEGIKDFEKIKILKEDLAMDPSMIAASYEAELKEFLSLIDYAQLKERPSSEIILKGQSLLYMIATR